MVRRAKIISTLGPAVDSRHRIRELIDTGMDVARINRSHGSHEEHARQIAWVREQAEAAGRAVAVLVDLQGPKIRTTRFSGGPVTLGRGDRFTITIDDVDGDRRRVGTTYKGLPGDVRAGDTLLVDDGKVTLRAIEVTASSVHAEVVEGGTISNNKGINLPGVAVSVPALSHKDETDLRWALRQGADWIALSFVRDAKDVERVHAVMAQEGVFRPVLAKIEKPQAVANLDEIVEAFDGIMVARGDLGVEMPLEEVPLVQKQAIDLARCHAKPVIVATQVLESMIENSRPTRAEASDCANAVLDGADAIMLSGETSIGAHPIIAVRTMARIIENTEDRGLHRIPTLGAVPSTTGGAVTSAAAEIGTVLDAKYLAVFTSSGDTARRMSRIRPELPMLAFTHHAQTRQRLALTWGITAILVPDFTNTPSMVRAVDEILVEQARCNEGDAVVVVAGTRHGVSGSTNLLQVHRIGTPQT